MAEHLLSNIYQVGGGDITHPWDAASYVIRGDKEQESVFIDFGSPLGFAALKLSCAEVGITTERISKILLTHAHFDHAAAAPQIDVPVYIQKAGLEALQTRDEGLTATFLYDGQIYPEIKNVKAIDDGFETNVGKTALRAFHTPGHSPDSMSWEVVTPEGVRILVAGDTLWGGYHERMASNLDDWQNSLDMLASKKFDYVTFGHCISFLIPNAMAHIDLARTVFDRNLKISANPRLKTPWPEA